MSRRWWWGPGVRLVDDAWSVQPVTEAPTMPATPVARHWQGVGDPPTGDEPPLGERLRAQQQPVALGASQAAPAPASLEVRQSVDGVLAVRDPRRTGRPGQPWLVIDVPPGHRAHWRDQSLSAIDVRTWTALLPEPDIDPRYFASYDQERLGTWPPKEQP